MPVMSERNLFTRILPGNSMREMNDWPVWLWAVLQRSHILTRSTFLLYSSFASAREEQLSAGSATTKRKHEGRPVFGCYRSCLLRSGGEIL